MPTVYRSRLFLGACLILAVALCYIPAMRAGFVWDDDLLVTENPLVKGTDSLPYVWSSSAATDYTPLTVTAFWLQWHLWGDNPAGYHLVNILLYAASVVLLWLVLARLAIPGAWLGALLFAVHPVNAASVAWVAELKNALSLPFYLAAILAYLRFLETRKLLPYCVALVATGCALLSKGSTVVLPVILLLCAGWKLRRVTRAELLHLIPFFLFAAAAAFVTIHFQDRAIAADSVPPPLDLRIARAGHALWFYLGKDVLPLHLSAIYRKWPLEDAFIPLIFAVAVAFALWLGSDGWGWGPLFALGYFAIALLPVLGIVNMSFLDQSYVADWWQQLALPAVTTFVGAGLAIAWRRTPQTSQTAAALLIGVIVFFLGHRTWYEASSYESMETLCRRTLARNPDAWTAHNNLGNVLNSQGRLPQAAHEYRKALDLKPSDSSTHSNLGTVYFRLHRFDNAIAEYHAALALEPSNAKFWFNLGNSLRAMHRDGDAIDAFFHALDYNARWTTPRYELGTIFLEQNRPNDAGHQAQIIVQLDPMAITGHYLLARAAAAIGRFDVASDQAQVALNIARQAGVAKAVGQMQDALNACKAGKTPTPPES